MQRFYYKNQSSLQKKFDSINKINGPLNINSIDKGIILPLKTADKSRIKVYEGGVCDKDFNFLAGYFRRRNNNKTNKSCVRSYIPNKKINYIDEEVVFAGICFGHFGHLITDSFSRLWFLKDQVLKNKKILFLNEPRNKNDWFQIFKHLGLKKDQIIILNEDENPIQFKKIYIPDQAFYFFESYHDDMIIPYEIIKNNVISNDIKYEKVYLSKTKLDSSDCINEEYFENFYREDGYEVIHPQELSFGQQVSILASAKKISATVGTLTHMLLFSSNNVELNGLARTNNVIPIFQHIVDKVRNIDFFYIDTSCNFLPYHHEFKCVYIGPNENWRRFVYDKKNILLSFNIFDFIDSNGKNFGVYIRRWSDYLVADKRTFSFISNIDAYDIADSVLKAEYSLLDKNREFRISLNDLSGLKNKINNKKFKLYISANEKEFRFDRIVSLENNGIIKTIQGKAHANESRWSILNGKLKFFSEKNIVTHEYLDSKIIDEKICFSGFYKPNSFILFRLEEVSLDEDVK